MLNTYNMSKFNPGDKCYLFNSISMKIEEDNVYGCLYVPIAVDGVKQDSNKSLSEKLAAGMMEVREQYQLLQHQGIIDADVLFASEEDCRKYYIEFLSK